MTKTKQYRRKSALIAALGLGLLGFGCGSSDTAIAPAVSSSTPSTGIVNGLLSCNNPNFIQECGCRGGTVLRTGDVNVCRVNIAFSPYYSSFQSYSPTNYGYFSSTSYGVQVEAGDRLKFKGSGGYGTIEGPDYDHWGPFYWWSYSGGGCEDIIGLDGKRGTEVVMNGEHPAGLLGAVGEEVFLIGKSYSDTFGQTGIFRYGLNLAVDPISTYGMCATVSVSWFYIEHCENSAGQTIACPAI